MAAWVSSMSIQTGPWGSHSAHDDCCNSDTFSLWYEQGTQTCTSPSAAWPRSNSCRVSIRAWPTLVYVRSRVTASRRSSHTKRRLYAKQRTPSRGWLSSALRERDVMRATCKKRLA